MLGANPLLSGVQHFELELVHNEGYDNLQDHQHDNEKAHEVDANQPASSDLWGKPLLYRFHKLHTLIFLGKPEI